MRGTIISILLATAVITGLYNKTELNGLTLMVAWLVGVAQRRLYEENALFLALPDARGKDRA
ncbi:hypothetical protein NHF48_022165 [Sphingomonas sp. H160509]|uniref:hypothetical protein n=1 Tax=Sphingomonas sp. H160509 TaxID=2955313 RepID=UPI0021E7F242|nr:hypothetical protein [Sphingomonas sp. H160509]MDD1453011.1 hypothetical protein [Sphingomonas sp. H160509]